MHAALKSFTQSLAEHILTADKAAYQIADPNLDASYQLYSLPLHALRR